MSSDDARRRRAEATRGGDHPPRGDARQEETCGGATHRERSAPPTRAAARTRRTAHDESIASFASKKSSRASPPRRSSRSVGRDAPERKSLRIGVHHANAVVWEPVWRRSLVARALVLATCVLVLAGAVPPVGAGLEKHQYMGAGFQHTCVVLDDGRAACWGEAGSGKLLGSGGPDGTCDFGTVDGTDGGPILTVKSVSVGYEHSCAVLSNDRVKCWGSQTPTGNRLGCGSDCNWNGHAGVGNSYPYVKFAAAMSQGPFLAKEVVAGAKHSCAITTGDELYCWGKNNDKQAGPASTGDPVECSDG